MNEYIYQASSNSGLQATEGIILLPDIYCQTEYSVRTTEEFAKSFKRPTFLIDYFYPLTGKANNLDPDDQELARKCMADLKGEEFVTFLIKVMGEIRVAYPQIKNFSVIGFCFGGRLAYLAGAHPDISKVISFYGGGAHTPDYIDGKTPIEYLIQNKGRNIFVRSFFGVNDPSITQEDRGKLKELFTNAGSDFVSYEYEAGHAYFQEGRKNFNQDASKASWQILREIFNGY